MILFLVKANYKIGFGHLSRCSSIAQELKSFNEKKFIHGVEHKLKGINYNCFTKIYSNKKNVFKIIKEKKITKIIIDRHISENDIKKLKKTGCKLLQLNYNFEKFKYIDFVINYLVPNKRKNVFNNMKYLIVKKDIINKYSKLKTKNKNIILVGLGGSLNKKYLKKILNSINHLKLKKFKVIFIFSKKIKIKNSLLNLENFEIIINPNNNELKKLYKKSNIGVSSGGLQLIEMIANRINVLSIGKNRIEQKNIDFFVKKGFCHTVRPNENIKIISNKLHSIINNNILRKKIEKNIVRNFSLSGSKNTANLIKRL